MSPVADRTDGLYPLQSPHIWREQDWQSQPFGELTIPTHLKEVDAIWYGKKKFYGFDEERLKSFV